MKYSYLSLVFISQLAYAQERPKGYSRLYPSYTIQGYYDQNSVMYDGIPPENYIHPQNTMGHNWGLQYERVTRYGLVLSAGLQYGMRRYDISLVRDLTDFDPRAINDLKGVIYTNKTKVDVNYWSYRFMAGYRLRLNNKMAVVAKGGASLRSFYDGDWGLKSDNVDYREDNGLSKTETITFITTEIGRDPAADKRGFVGLSRFPKGLLSWDMYAGVEREFDSSFIKNISIGIEGSRNWWMLLNSGEMTVRSVSSAGQRTLSYEHFFDHNISLGLRVAVGLWR